MDMKKDFEFWDWIENLCRKIGFSEYIISELPFILGAISGCVIGLFLNFLILYFIYY